MIHVSKSLASESFAAGEALPAAPANAPDQKSVAVLPFVNLNDEKESESAPPVYIYGVVQPRAGELVRLPGRLGLFLKSLQLSFGKMVLGVFLLVRSERRLQASLGAGLVAGQ